VNKHIFREYDIRGTVEDDLDTDTVLVLGRAIGTFLAGGGCRRILLGRDVRPSSEDIRDQLAGGLVGCGLEVLDMGVCPTPVLYWATRRLDADGGVMITGSHNPPEYNGFKIVLGELSIYGREIREIRRIADSGEFIEGPGRLATVDVLEDYRSDLAGRFAGPMPLRVVVDCANGTAGLAAVEVYRSIGCDVVPLFCEVDGRFPNHHPDPTVEAYLRDLARTVVETGADVGVGFDGDADRIGVVDETGRFVPADELLMVFARAILPGLPGATVIGDVKCSQRLFDEIRRLGGRPVMWKSGHSLIKAKMREENAVLAGELAGHLCFADRYHGYDDAIYAGARLIEILAGFGGPLNGLLEGLPEAFATPELRVDCPEEYKFEVVRRLRDELEAQAGARVITLDGVRVDYGDGWGLVRASNTQPMLVMRFEAGSAARLWEIRATFEHNLAKAVNDVSSGAAKWVTTMS
jgi:phosphomannomutase / phosphoglucomutase